MPVTHSGVGVGGGDGWAGGVLNCVPAPPGSPRQTVMDGDGQEAQTDAVANGRSTHFFSFFLSVKQRETGGGLEKVSLISMRR